MKKAVIRIWNLMVTVSLIYYGLFFLMLLLGVLGWTDSLIPDQDLQRAIKTILSFGMVLFWIYLIALPLGLTGVLRMPKKQFLTLAILVAMSVVLFVLSEVG